MRGNIHACRESFSFSAEYNDRNVGPRLDDGENLRQFLHHGDINDIQRRMAQFDARDQWPDINGDS
jgi:hypothetical protein